MELVYIISLLLIQAEITVLAVCGAVLHFKGKNTERRREVLPESDDKSAEERKAEELEKIFRDSINAITGYDLNVARKAVRYDAEDERQSERRD